MAAIGSFSLLRNCAVTQRAFSNVKLSQSAAFSFNSIKFFHRRLSQRCNMLPSHSLKGPGKWTNILIAPDEKTETIELDYDGKRDRWNGYDPSSYTPVVEICK